MLKHDEKVVEEAIYGKRKAANNLVELYFEDILYFAISKVDYQEGQEVAQQSVIQILANIRKLRDPSKFKAWTMSIVYRKNYQDCLMLYYYQDMSCGEIAEVLQVKEIKNCPVRTSVLTGQLFNFLPFWH